MRFVPLGVRGSTPAPGADFLWYGHTSCVAVLADGDSRPKLVLDAGTGLSSLPSLLDGEPFVGSIVLSHLHWDHVQGLPFCRSVDDTRARVTLHIPVDAEDTDPHAVLARGFSPPHFPIGPDGLLGEWCFRALLPGVVDPAVCVSPVAHKGGPAFGIRVSLDGAVLAYLPDHALHSGLAPSSRSSAEHLVHGADVLLHDGQHVRAEDRLARAYGHATVEEVLAFADRCEVGSLVLTHHAPNRTDDALDDFATRFRHTPAGRPVTFARQDVAIEVPARTRCLDQPR